uniref:Uncharacterized protein n=1 Tax=Anguilla anguilla TaxID=7936 RepID=A0A0E9PRW9_ANGAN
MVHTYMHIYGASKCTETEAVMFVLIAIMSGVIDTLQDI